MPVPKLRYVKIAVGTRVCDAPQNGRWGTVIHIEDTRKTAKAPSEKLVAKNRPDPMLYTVRWDTGIESKTWRKPLWFDGDDPRFGRPVLKDPKRKEQV